MEAEKEMFVTAESHLRGIIKVHEETIRNLRMEIIRLKREKSHGKENEVLYSRCPTSPVG
jgi:hypothetical protein